MELAEEACLTGLSSDSRDELLDISDLRRDLHNTPLISPENNCLNKDPDNTATENGNSLQSQETGLNSLNFALLGEHQKSPKLS